MEYFYKHVKALHLFDSGVTTPGQLWAMPRLPCPQIDKTFYVTLMLLVSCPGCSFTLVTPLLFDGNGILYELLTSAPESKAELLYRFIDIYSWSRIPII